MVSFFVFCYVELSKWRLLGAPDGTWYYRETCNPNPRCLGFRPLEKRSIILSSSEITKLTQFSILNCIHLSRRAPSLILVVIIGYLIVGSSNYKCETFNVKRFYILMQISLIFTRKVFPLALLRNWGLLKLGGL